MELPNEGAEARAVRVVEWALARGFGAETDHDALGGVAVWLRHARRPKRSAWVSCMNNGKDTLVLTDRQSVVHHSPWTDAARTMAADFLAQKLPVLGRH